MHSAFGKGLVVPSSFRVSAKHEIPRGFLTPDVHRFSSLKFPIRTIRFISRTCSSSNFRARFTQATSAVGTWGGSFRSCHRSVFLNVWPLIRTKSFSTTSSARIDDRCGSAAAHGKNENWREAAGSGGGVGENEPTEHKTDIHFHQESEGHKVDEVNRNILKNFLKESGYGDKEWNGQDEYGEFGDYIPSSEDDELAKGLENGRTLPWLDGSSRTNKFLKGARPLDPMVNKISRNRAENMKNIEDDVVGDGRDDDVGSKNGPRWDKIKVGGRVIYKNMGSKRPQKQSKHEYLGRKVWQEARSSKLVMVAEGLYGVGPVLAALMARRREFYTLYIQEGLDLSTDNKKKKDKKQIKEILKIADEIGLSIREASKLSLNLVADNRPHQGLVLDASPLEMVDIKELELFGDGDEKHPFWLALDEVVDPQNFGAIIRSAYFFGISGVVVCAKNSAPLSGVVSKASAGSLELMELRSCKNMMKFLSSSAHNGWRVLGASVSSEAVPLSEVLPNEPAVLVLGNEGLGLRALVERSCTQLIKISGNVAPYVVGKFGRRDVEDAGLERKYGTFFAVESLNVSVAAGVLLHHFIGKN